MTAEEDRALSAVHESYAVTDAWAPIVLAWVSGREEPPSTGDILAGALRIEPGKWTRGDEMRVSKILTRAGWRKEKRHRGGRVWVNKQQP
jgi:predicted P-loop ATPase